MAIKSLLSVAVAAAILSSCGSPDADRDARYSSARQICATTAQRIERDPLDRPYTQILVTECLEAADALATDGNTIASWYATAYIKELSEFNEVINALDRFPNRFGEYLIANEIGLNSTLDAWILSSQSRALRT